MPPKIVDRESRRRQIAAAAMSLFSESGFEATSMNQVARAAGIGKGTIYEYFRSKDELIAASIQIWVGEMMEGIGSAVGGVVHPEERLRTFVQASVQAFMADDSTMKTAVAVFQTVLSNIESPTFSEGIQDAFEGIWSTIVDIIMEGNTEGVFHIRDESEAERIAINLAAFLDGIFLHHLITGKRFDLLEQVNHYMEYLLETHMKRGK